jgi:hypothetical protein
MKFEKHYIGNESEKRKKAMSDIRFWLGGDKGYRKVMKRLRDFKDCEQFEIACQFVGIQGFPVIAFYEHINGAGTWIEFDEFKGSDAD